MSKVIELKDYRRIDTRSSDLQREVELRERNTERMGEWQLKMYYALKRQTEAFRGGFGHKGPGGDAA